MTNTSATGGFLKPAKLTLNVNQFIQTVIVGMTGLPGPLVRAKWQPKPPPEPNLDINWCAFSIVNDTADANAAVVTDIHDVTSLERSESLEIACSFYGPDSYENAGILRDGFQIPQNNASMRAAKMGFIGSGIIQRVPDLKNENWVDRNEISIFLTRRIQRVYSILPFASATGEIRVVLEDGLNIIDWLVE